MSIRRMLVQGVIKRYDLPMFNIQIVVAVIQVYITLSVYQHKALICY
jgi:hypothetical protein